VLCGVADVCVATRSAARAYGLDFVSLSHARYDFVMRKEALTSPAVQTFLDLLQRASLRKKLQMYAGYDTTNTGSRL
jgi:molybdate-binding protein